MLPLMNATAMTPEQRTETVQRHVTEQRLAPYMNATFNDVEKAVELYLWDRRLSSAFFHDISMLEVALRNTLDQAMVDRFGQEWFRISASLFDQRTYSQIADAWDRLPSRFHEAPLGDKRIRGRLVASCMFGTWVSALDAGGKTGLDGPCATVNHDDVWTRGTLLKAFPGARKIAGGLREQLTRQWIHHQVREVHILRNRLAHHESLINGYPNPGTGGKDAKPERRTVEDGVTACRRLSHMIDSSLNTLIGESSDLDDVLAADPRPGWGFV